MVTNRKVYKGVYFITVNMANWKDRLPELFPEMRRTFCLDDKAAVGASHYWHTGVATGVILPIKGVKRQGHLLWQTPYQVTGGGRVDKYQLAEEGEIIVYPEPCRIVGESVPEEPLAYLIAINPAPGLETAFEGISDEALRGLLAHELAEVNLARQQPNYHHRITHHGLPEHEVDKMASERGYGNQVKAYLNFLRDNVGDIRERPRQRSFFDSLAEMGVNVIGGSRPEIPETLVTEVCRAELETRLNLLSGKPIEVKPNIAGYLPGK